MKSKDNKSPGFWFYPADFERDMQILSLESQGLWSRMLCWMHENEAHRGFIELPSGEPMTSVDIASKVGKQPRDIEKCLSEMARVGTYSKDERGCLYCRRMARETHISSVRKAAAKSRMESSKRAADGSFAGDFAPPNNPAKAEQKPTVTASASDSVSDSSNGVRRSSLIGEFPETANAVRSFFPVTDDNFITDLFFKCVQADRNVTDAQVSDAVYAVYTTAQRGPGLFLNTVPKYVSGILLGRNAKSRDPTLSAHDESTLRIMKNLEKMHAQKSV